jgi:hypothetical protein
MVAAAAHDVSNLRVFGGVTVYTAKPGTQDAERLALAVVLGTQALIDPLPLLRWLPDQLDGGIALTQTGNLNRTFVQDSADRFGWDFSRPPRTEDLYDLYDLYQLTDTGQATALEALRSRATGPRTVPWP